MTPSCLVVELEGEGGDRAQKCQGYSVSHKRFPVEFLTSSSTIDLFFYEQVPILIVLHVLGYMYRQMCMWLTPYTFLSTVLHYSTDLHIAVMPRNAQAKAGKKRTVC